MTEEEALKGLVKHEDLFNQVTHDKALPDASHGAVQEIAACYKVLDPGYFIDWNCRTCIFNMFKHANKRRLDYIKEVALRDINDPKYYKF